MSFCEFEYSRTQTNKLVQRAFVREFAKNAPTAMQILTWHKKFKKEGCEGKIDQDDYKYCKRRLKTCEIVHKIHIPLNLSYKF